MSELGARDEIAALAEGFGVIVADEAVCPGHTAPLDVLTTWVLDRPAMSVTLGPRGGGKSYLSGLATHLDSICYDKHGTRVLGGSLSQSEQIYNALRDFYRVNAGAFKRFTKTRAEYRNGSEVAILPASETSVRGPHVPKLRLDEVDEIEADIRDSALGMCMSMNGAKASVDMTSTWHNLGGPMEGLLERGRAGEFPTFTFCAFEALERCPAERSGPAVGGPDRYAYCPECPLRPWCHDVAPSQLPKAKRSAGHYTIDSLIQKVRGVSLRVFEADYLCKGPKADGLWFKGFDLARHVDAGKAEYDPAIPAYLGVDPGVWTGGSFLQVRDVDGQKVVTVFADYLSEGLTAEANARAILEVARVRCNGKLRGQFCDPAGGSRTPIGPTVVDEFKRVGLHLTPWAKANPSVPDSLNRIEGLLNPADGVARIFIHPRCVHTIRAFQSYRRKKRTGQWIDYPEDPQHPHEELIDSLRGGLHPLFTAPPAPAMLTGDGRYEYLNN